MSDLEQRLSKKRQKTDIQSSMNTGLELGYLGGLIPGGIIGKRFADDIVMNREAPGISNQKIINMLETKHGVPVVFGGEKLPSPYYAPARSPSRFFTKKWVKQQPKSAYIALTSPKNAPEIILHEFGHHQNRLNAPLTKLRAPGLLIGSLGGFLMANKVMKDSGGQDAGTAAAYSGGGMALGMAPTLYDEYKASANSLRSLKELGATRKYMSLAKSNLRGAFGTYGAFAGALTAGAVAMPFIGKALYNAKHPKTKTATEDKRKRNAGLAVGAIGTTGATALLQTKAPAPKVYYKHDIHLYDEIKDLHKAKEYNSNRARKGDVVLTNYSHMIPAYKKKGLKSIYFAADHGDAPHNISKVQEANNLKLNWGTTHPEGADVVVGTKGIKANPGQRAVEVANLPVSREVKFDQLPVARKAGRVNVGLTFGQKSQAGTFLGYARKGRDYNVKDYGIEIGNTGDFSKVENIVKALDTHYGPEKYHLEIFGGNDPKIQKGFTKQLQPYANRVSVTPKVAPQDFVNRMKGKDLIFSNLGSSLPYFTQNERKIPIIAVDTKVKRVYTANYASNRKWLTENHPNVQFMQDTHLKDPERIVKTLKESKGVMTGKPVSYTPAPVQSAIDDIVSTGKESRNRNMLSRFNAYSRPRQALTAGVVTTGVAGLGYAATKLKKNHE